jgi:putative hydrolase of the HAD superfamily
MYKHIIFDFGGVFLKIGKALPEDIVRIFNTSIEEAERHWDNHRAGLLTGKTSSRELLERVNAELGSDLNIDRAHGSWRSRYKIRKNQINWALLSYALRLKKKYKIHMLTDTIDFMDGSDKWTREVHKHFENVLMSHEQGVSKRQKEAFFNALEKIGAKPDECIFIDDLEANVEIANKVGMKGILFTDTRKLKRDMHALGVI